MTAIMDSPANTPVGLLDSLELEITGGCQLTCTHCLSESSPQGTHGAMAPADWKQVIEDAAALEIPGLQLIGGEPTLYPHWVELVDLALSLGRRVEVFSNLFHVAPKWWSVLSREGVTLATSYYSDRADEHDRITTRPGSHARTRANLVEAHRRGIPVRVGILEVFDGQRVAEACTEIEAMGIADVDTDRVRAVGRAAGSAAPSADALCGRCGRGKAAVLPNGDLALCVLSRFMPCGNVREQRLAELVGSERWWQAVGKVPPPGPTACQPDGSDCNPAKTPACLPKFPAAPLRLTAPGGER
ncbi:radical SAM/SPASM domain-containing protein [Streptomyces spectabilis]|uniref:radical SAM/SPASM domain-containing protein n=1 Tax=Streptomyces spectabilis TaxID=68270 RepID=UPI0033D3B510